MKTKVFISQPMSGLTMEEILENRKDAKEKIYDIFGEENVEIIDTINNGLPDDSNPLKFLGFDIDKLAEADYIYFANNWELSRGCNVEFLCAKLYGIKMFFE